MANISIDQLSNAIANAVRDYTEEVSEAISKETDAVAAEVIDELKTNYPYNERFPAHGYTAGWRTIKQDKNGRTRRVIWNKTHYQIVHLLEFGHAKRGGGRVPAFPHVKPAYDKFGAKLPYRIRRIIERGGSS